MSTDTTPRVPEVALTESELRTLMDTWTLGFDTFMDAVQDALFWKAREAETHPEARALDDAQIDALIAEYDACVRRNAATTTHTNVLADVANCDEGIYGAYGEVLDLIPDGGPDITDSDRDAIEDAFKLYQERLRAELRGNVLP